MKKLAALAAFGLLIGSAAFADAPPSHYDITPLTKADVDLYLSVLRSAAAHVQNAKGEDRAAIDYMKKNHGTPKFPSPPATPVINGPPTPAQMAAIKKSQSDYQVYLAKIRKPQEYMDRAGTLSNYDEEIARQRHIEEKYDAVKYPIENGMDDMSGAVGDCGGCQPSTQPTAAQKALWKKEDGVRQQNVVFLKRYAPEVKKLRKVLSDVESGQ